MMRDANKSELVMAVAQKQKITIDVPQILGSHFPNKGAPCQVEFAHAQK